MTVIFKGRLFSTLDDPLFAATALASQMQWCIAQSKQNPAPAPVVTKAPE